MTVAKRVARLRWGAQACNNVIILEADLETSPVPSATVSPEFLKRKRKVGAEKEVWTCVYSPKSKIDKTVYEQETSVEKREQESQSTYSQSSIPASHREDKQLWTDESPPSWSPPVSPASQPISRDCQEDSTSLIIIRSLLEDIISVSVSVREEKNQSQQESSEQDMFTDHDPTRQSPTSPVSPYLDVSLGLGIEASLPVHMESLEDTAREELRRNVFRFSEDEDEQEETRQTRARSVSQQKTKTRSPV